MYRIHACDLPLKANKCFNKKSRSQSKEAAKVYILDSLIIVATFKLNIFVAQF